MKGYNDLSEETKQNISVLEWNKVITAIPQKWQKELNKDIMNLCKYDFIIPINIFNKCRDLTSVNNKLLYNQMVYNKHTISKACERYYADFSLELKD